MDDPRFWVLAFGLSFYAVGIASLADNYVRKASFLHRMGSAALFGFGAGLLATVAMALFEAIE